MSTLMVLIPNGGTRKGVRWLNYAKTKIKSITYFFYYSSYCYYYYYYYYYSYYYYDYYYYY